MNAVNPEVKRGTAVYSKRVLRLYDLVVVHLSNSLVWRCSRHRQLAHYQENVGARHLDVGPGTGWYLAHADLPAGTEITLLDLNANSLVTARERVAGLGPQPVVGNVLEPLANELGPFDSIATNHVFHCVPGTWSEKGVAFGHLAQRLAPGGVLFGATILGTDVRHSLAGRRLMSLYNHKGIFHNTDDDLDGLRQELDRHFTQTTVEVIGTVALFRATGRVQ